MLLPDPLDGNSPLFLRETGLLPDDPRIMNFLGLTCANQLIYDIWHRGLATNRSSFYGRSPFHRFAKTFMITMLIPSS